jgi:hypothetical protein
VPAVQRMVVGGALPPMWCAQAQHGIQPGPDRRSAENSRCGPIAAQDAQSTYDFLGASERLCSGATGPAASERRPAD